MGNIKFKNDIEFDYVLSFYNKINLKPRDLATSKNDRFFTYNLIIDFLIQSDKLVTIQKIKYLIKTDLLINEIFISIVNEDEDLNTFIEVIEYYDDLDLLARFLPKKFE